jgi:hypothetical protein
LKKKGVIILKSDIYALLDVPDGNAMLLSNVYSMYDQAAFKDKSWDYDNPNFICRRVVELIEGLPDDEITIEEREWFQEICWFFHHHSASYAIFLKKDKNRAKEEVELALNFQANDHPNKITKLLYYLLSDMLREAEEYVKTINGVEFETALWLIDKYKNSWSLEK